MGQRPPLVRLWKLGIAASTARPAAPGTPGRASVGLVRSVPIRLAQTPTTYWVSAEPHRDRPINRTCRVGPGNFTPSPSQNPDLILSHHPARVIGRRLPPSVVCWAPPVAGWPNPTPMTRPLRSSPITGPSSLLQGSSAPSPAHRYFRPRGWSRLCLFPWHRSPRFSRSI